MSQDTLLTAARYGGHRVGYDDDPDTLLGAPDAYDPFDVPNDMHMDPGLSDRFVNMARSLNLSQRGAQRLIDTHLEALSCQHHAHNDYQMRQRERWRADIQSDPEMGGARFAENIARARDVMRTFGSPVLRQMLDETGLGDHPDVVRFFVRIGKAIGEGSFVPGASGISEPPSPAKILYPNMN